jgi:hypothetical protein
MTLIKYPSKLNDTHLKKTQVIPLIQSCFYHATLDLLFSHISFLIAIVI